MQQLGPHIAQVLRDARATRGYTQSEVAEGVGMAVEAYARIERGIVIPRADTIERLVRMLRVSADVLLGTSSATEVPPQRETESPEMRRAVRRLKSLSPRSLQLLEQFLGSVERDAGDGARPKGRSRRRTARR